MKQSGGGADATAWLDCPHRSSADLERDRAVDRARFDRLAVRTHFGGPKATGRAGLGQRPAIDEQRVERSADAAHVGGRSGVRQGGRERQSDVTVDGDADPAGVVDREGDAGSMRLVRRRRKGLNRAGAAQRRRGRRSDLAQGPAANPLRDHQSAAVVDGRDVQYPGQARPLDPTQLLGAGQDLLDLFVAPASFGVDERERHLPVE